MTLQKPDKDKKPFECPYCGSMNTGWEDNCTESVTVMYCAECDSSWFEYEDNWESVFQKGKVIKENEN
jgi:transcription elongation factor Elf1